MFSFFNRSGKIKQSINEQAMADIRRLVAASRNGDLKTRVNVDAYEGDLAEVMNSINAILDETTGPISSQSVALQKMADGDLSHRIMVDFKGDHSQVKDALNRIANLAELAMKEIHRLVEASRIGDLKSRADARSFAAIGERL